MEQSIELIIDNGVDILIPIVVDKITVTINRFGSPSVLNFEVLKDEMLNFTEGNHVRLRVNDKNVFYGFVFTKKGDKSDKISVTAYDQLRYLKNKDSVNFVNITASEVIKRITKDFNLNLGYIEDTKYVIDSVAENDKTLFDIMCSALDKTLQGSKELFVLYDDFGKITLKNISSLMVDLVITENSGENYSYTTSIDSDTYNQVRIIHKDKATNIDGHYVVKSSENINKWGVLELVEKANSPEVAVHKANALLELHNKKTRKLTLSSLFGDLRVRAGSLVVVNLDLGDIILSNRMLVEKCKHTFDKDTHFMDLTLRGNGFSE